MRLVCKIVLVSSLLMLLACTEKGVVRPDFVIQDAHSSGSLVAVDTMRPLAASGGLEGTISLWDLDTGKELAAWHGHQGTVNGLAVSSRGKRVISAGWDGVVAAWNLDGKPLRRMNAGTPVTAMAAAPGLSRIWTGHSDGSLRLWNRDLELLEERRLPVGKRITAMALVRGGLAVADQGGGVWLYAGPDSPSPRQLASLPAYIRSLVFRPDGRVLFGGSWFRLYRWDLDKGTMNVLDTPHKGIIAGLDWSPTSRELMSISRQTDSSVLALDPDTGSARANFGKHDLCGASVAVTPDGRYLVTTSDDASVRIWRLGNRP